MSTKMGKIFVLIMSLLQIVGCSTQYQTRDLATRDVAARWDENLDGYYNMSGHYYHGVIEIKKGQGRDEIILRGITPKDKELTRLSFEKIILKKVSKNEYKTKFDWVFFTKDLDGKDIFKSEYEIAVSISYAGFRPIVTLHYTSNHMLLVNGGSSSGETVDSSWDLDKKSSK